MKMKLKLLLNMLSIFTLFILFNLYAGNEGQSGKIYGRQTSGKIHFPKIRDYNVILECVSPQRTFTAGKPAFIRFRLKNRGSGRIVVYEWMMNESDNLQFYYIPWEKNMKTRPSKDGWIRVSPAIKEPIRRMTLELAPGNSVLMEKKLEFIENIKTGSIASQDYLMYFELTLESFQAKSNIIKITVKP